MREYVKAIAVGTLAGLLASAIAPNRVESPYNVPSCPSEATAVEVPYPACEAKHNPPTLECEPQPKPRAKRWD